MSTSGYKAVIGLEVHAQLATQSKIFCGDAVEFGGGPNTRTSPISLGHPGTLPTLNARCVEFAIKMGLAVGCEIDRNCYFARKNYFYPDLPKGYQISQDETPICRNGYLDLRLKDGTKKRIRIQRIHIEEDAGKSIHDQDPFFTLLDFNRASTGLIEIVTHPDISSAEEAAAYLTEIRKIVRYLQICDGNMEEGSLRCDANVSVMKTDATEFGTRAEIKNINSISNVAKAINYEITRQIKVLTEGGKVVRETRTWDAVQQRTLSLRDKESADDYRYFPEPDLLPLQITEEYLAKVKAELPLLPEALFDKYTQTLKLPADDAILLAEQREFSNYFHAVLEHFNHPKPVANWLLGPVRGYLNEMALDITRFPLMPEKLAALIQLVDGGKVSITIAREQLFPLLLASPDVDPEQLARDQNLLLDNDLNAIDAAIADVITNSPTEVATYKSGKTGLLGFFVGKVMKACAGKADPKIINTRVKQALDKA